MNKITTRIFYITQTDIAFSVTQTDITQTGNFRLQSKLKAGWLPLETISGCPRDKYSRSFSQVFLLNQGQNRSNFPSNGLFAHSPSLGFKVHPTVYCLETFTNSELHGGLGILHWLVKVTFLA